MPVETKGDKPILLAEYVTLKVCSCHILPNQIHIHHIVM